MQPAALFTWKEAPFLRLFLPFVAGIATQYYSQWPALTSWLVAGISLTTLLILSRTPIAFQFRFRWLNGPLILLLLFATGLLLSFYKDPRHHPQWIGTNLPPGTAVIVSIEAPLSPTTNSWKTIATIESILQHDSIIPTSGTILLYFQKDSFFHRIHYRDRLVFIKPLQPVKNTGNPGSFDYRRYCALQGIHHQVYLKHGDFSLLSSVPTPLVNRKSVKQFLFNTREKVISLLKKYIPGNKECGLAEALLIGYKQDLDKSLVQSYSDTGVVHVIAISGLHLGLVFLILSFLCHPLGKHPSTRWLKTTLIIIGLWLFSLLAGGTPSVLRSAIMFTCLALGQNLSKQTSVFNSLAASAFLLLCYNPYWLWDAGFQLSYTAVLSIAIFQKPIYHLLFVKNKWLDHIWKLIAVTTAAQILTLPVSLYHFHQFPTLFLVANLLAIPLSSLILFGELLLCAVAFLPTVATIIGKLLHWLIWLLNSFIETLDTIPAATINGIRFDWPQLILMYACITALTIWRLQKNKKALIIALILLLGFTGISTGFLWQSSQQQKIIVYQVPHHQAIDFIAGRNYLFKGDRSLQENQSLQNFHLQPARTRYSVHPTNILNGLQGKNNCWWLGSLSIVLIDSSMRLPVAAPKNYLTAKIPASIIVLSNNPSIQMDLLVALFECKQVVIDGSNPPRKAARWRRDCQRLGIPCHFTPEQGAFVLNAY